MNKTLFFSLFLSSNLLFCTIHADIDLDEQNVGSERIKEVATKNPFSFQTHVDVISPSKINHGFQKGDHISFAEADDVLGAVVLYNDEHTEGVRLSLGYTATYIHWANNPLFDQEHFQVFSINCAGFTKRLKDWFWRTQLSINIDTDHWSTPYTNYDIVLWGRYDYSKTMGLHFGFWGQTGMRMDRVYPIIGFDWQIRPKWKLSLVYPVNISLQYALTKTWSLAIAGRTFDSRHRLGDNSGWSKALVHYENLGAEFAVVYDGPNASGNIHVGTTLGGRYRIANSKNHHPRNFHMDPSTYAGAQVEVSF